ncbi:hypothetical protein RUM43_008511 [Polyplax serrata]|uniref:Uncharacterized protein n=1 Tax=Polyplax serrata TaxID=468196 RepID=A0AAN8RTT6_POLSC
MTRCVNVKWKFVSEKGKRNEKRAATRREQNGSGRQKREIQRRIRADGGSRQDGEAGELKNNRETNRKQSLSIGKSFLEFLYQVFMERLPGKSFRPRSPLLPPELKISPRDLKKTPWPKEKLKSFRKSELSIGSGSLEMMSA